MKVKSIKSDYYNNPDRIMIGVDITTLIDVFEENYLDMTGKEFNWDKDGETFNEMSDELDHICEKHMSEKFGHTAVEEFHDDDSYCFTFWGDRNESKDLDILAELQGSCDDSWKDNNRVNLAFYDTEVFCGNLSSFLDKWGEMGDEYGVMADALTYSVVAGVDFPEEFDSDPMYDKVGGMNIKNSKRLKSSRQIKSGYTGTNVSVEYGPYGEEKEFPFFDMKGMSDEEIDDVIGYYEEVKTAWGSDGESYMILEDHAYSEDKIAVLEDDYNDFVERYFK